MERENASNQELEMPICGLRSGEELHSLISREILVQVEHVEAHRAEKDKKEMSRFERFVADGNEKTDELAKEGAMKDGFMAQVRAKTFSAGKRRSVCSITVCGQLPLFGLRMERL